MLTIAEALNDLQVREAERDEYRRFYRGEQGVHLRTPELRRQLKGSRGFSINFCKTIVESLTDRVQVKAVNASVKVDGIDDVRAREEAEKTASTAATEALRVIWERSALDINALAYRYSVDADAFVGLQVDDAGPTLKRLDAGSVAPLDENATFVKTSDTTGIVITESVVIQYALDSAGEWQPVKRVNEIGEDELAADPVLDPEGASVPTILERIRNGDDDTAWGMSDLAVAVPQQRAINQRAIDVHQVAGTAAWPQRWLVGPNAASAAVRLLTSAPGAIHGINAPAEGAMELKEFSAADPTKLSATLEQLVEFLSVTTGTPLQPGSVGANASGDSRRLAQDKLTRRVMKALDAIGTALSRLLESALRIEGVVADVSIDWESPEPVAAKDTLETALLKKSLGVSTYTLLLELGYDPDKEEMLRAADRAEEQVALTRALTTGTDTPADLNDLLGPASGA
jgi:hypothetical protein